jgi:RecQ family ATP-dependent DNA helicase
MEYQDLMEPEDYAEYQTLMAEQEHLSTQMHVSPHLSPHPVLAKPAITRADMEELLFINTGYKNLKDKQYEIIMEILNNHDVVALLPTGYGKSLIFIMIYLINNANILIISPLLALINDQKQQLDEWKIPIIYLNSDNKRIEADLLDLKNGKKAIIYATPDYVSSHIDVISGISLNLKLITIDECHCVLSWGEGFRPVYLNLQHIKLIMPNIPMLCLTATGTPKRIDELSNLLHLDKPKIITTKLIRDNQIIKVIPRNKEFINQLIDHLSLYPDKKVLIYCFKKDDTENYANSLSANGYKCLSYHAGKTKEVRHEIASKFKTGEIKYLTATIAFGMGIDIQDIDVIIHTNLPDDLEQYCQEIGRAGRNGNDCHCILFSGAKDIKIREHFNKQYTGKEMEHKTFCLNEMVKYTRLKSCRQEFILNYFNSMDDTYQCNRCDNCVRRYDFPRDFTMEYKKVYNIITTLDLQFKQLIVQLTNLNLYPDTWWYRFVDLLYTCNYLSSHKKLNKKTKKDTKVKLIKPTKQGDELNNKTKIVLYVDTDFKNGDIILDKNKKINEFMMYFKDLNLDIPLIESDIDNLLLKNINDIVYLLLKYNIPSDEIIKKLNIKKTKFDLIVLQTIEQCRYFDITQFKYTKSIYDDLIAKLDVVDTEQPYPTIAKEINYYNYFFIKLTQSLNTFAPAQLHLYNLI